MIPDELIALNRWVLWRTEERDGKPTKVLYNPHAPSSRASSIDPKTWADYTKSRKVADMVPGINGVGFVFNGDGYVFIDFDHVRNADTGEIDPAAMEEITSFDSFAEVSPSGTGVHVLCRGKIPGDRGRNNQKAGREIYTTGRFATVTGEHVTGTPETINEAQAVIDPFYSKYWPESPPEPTRSSPALTPTPDTLTDDQVIALAKRAKNREKFLRLMDGDISGYASQSEADLAFCDFLAFHTRDTGQIFRIIKRSELYRDKWDRDDYRTDTINKAIQGAMLQRPLLPTIDPEPDEIDLICAQYPPTDLGNSKRLIERHGDNIRYCPSVKRWYIWNGHQWEEDKRNRILEIAKATAIKIGDEAKCVSDTTTRSQLFKWAGASQMNPRIAGMISLAKSAIPVLPEELDANPNLLNFKNGTLELDSLTFRPHRREDKLSMCMGTDYIPGADCPKWKKQIELVFENDKKKITFFQDFCGYHFQHDHPMQQLFIHHGDGQNGRSVVFGALEHVFGDYCGGFPTELLLYHRDKSSKPSPQPELLDSVKKRFLIAKEIDRGKALSEGDIKRWTGGDTEKARFLYDNKPHEFKGTLKISLLTNNMPRMRGTDKGIRRRIVKIPYLYEIPEEMRRPMTDVMGELVDEAPGIVQWMIEGYKRVRENKNRSITLIEAVTDATNEYQEREDVFRRFLDEMCVIDDKTHESDCITPTAAVAQYNAWAEREGESTLKPGQVKEEMVRRFGKVQRTSTSRFYKGVRLKSEKELQASLLSS